MTYRKISRRHFIKVSNSSYTPTDVFYMIKVQAPTQELVTKLEMFYFQQLDKQTRYGHQIAKNRIN